MKEVPSETEHPVVPESLVEKNNNMPTKLLNLLRVVQAYYLSIITFNKSQKPVALITKEHMALEVVNVDLPELKGNIKCDGSSGALYKAKTKLEARHSIPANVFQWCEIGIGTMLNKVTQSSLLPQVDSIF